MGRKAEGWPFVCQQRCPPIDARLSHLDASSARVNEIVVPHQIERGILNYRARQIVPHAIKNLIDLTVGFIQKCRLELGPG
jgi:hypothetical protein